VQDGPRLEDGAVLVRVDDDRDLVVGVEAQKVGLGLVAVLDVDDVDVVRQPDLLEHNRGLVAVRSLVGVGARACFQTRTGCLEADQPWHVVQAKPAISGLP
jgi:hypothetical protein